ncbi:MAG: hypothetical protein [Circoviridae sp.]|nr:MAG: hypothetical protein [Circoviridae sp.]
MNITSILTTRTTPHVYTTFMYTRLFVDSWRSYIGELRRTASGLGLQRFTIYTWINALTLMVKWSPFGGQLSMMLKASCTGSKFLTCYTTLPAKK